MFNKLSIRDINLLGKKVLVRADFNVPLNDKGEITDNSRILKSLPTIKHILQKGGSIIAMSHMGRPKGKRDMKYSLLPVAQELSSLLGIPVALAPDCIGEQTKQMCDEMGKGEVVLLENLRFHKEEKDNADDFARQLASLGDLMVNDAFGACHRAHASISGIPRYLKTAMGFLVEKELEYFGNALSNPQRPFVAITGGAKVSDKIPVLENLIGKVNTIIIGGGMSYTFLKAKGEEVGSSIVDEDSIEVAARTLKLAEEAGIKVILPIDHVIADAFDKDANRKVVTGNIPEGWMALDIGPATIKLVVEELKTAGTVVWNGPLGVFEMEPFAEGTKAVAIALAQGSATSILGGGDTGAAAIAFGVAEKMSHISTGGGASLELLQGKLLPGVAAISDK